MTVHNRLTVILVLGTTQTLAWASSFYLPAILGDRIAEDLAMSSTWFFAAFSAALVVSALVGAARWPDGGRSWRARGARGFQRGLCRWTGDSRLCSFASDAVVGLDGSRTRYGDRPIRHSLCGTRPDLRA